MDNKISIILSTYNEANCIEDTIKKLKDNIPNLELVIVDDNSPDGTFEILKKFESKDIKIINRESTRGLASAFLCGMLYTTGDKIGWIDSNMGKLASKFPEMIKELVFNDLVLLSRYTENGSDRRNNIRIIFSVTINKLCNIFLTNKIKDFTSSIFIMNKRVLKKVVPISYGHGEFFIEFLFNCHKKKIKIKEIPYIQINDSYGNSKTAPNIFNFIYMGLFYLIRIFLSIIRRN